MKNGLLIIERITIESLAKKEKNLQELMIDTNLNHSLMINVLSNLVMKNMIRYDRGIYSLNKENCFSWLNEVNDKDNVKEEVKELFIALVNQYFQKNASSIDDFFPQLKIQKMWLTREEEVVLRSHLSNLEAFFSGIRVARKTKPEKETTCKQRVVIWGLSQYSDLVDGILKAI